MPAAIASHSHRPTTKVSHKPFKSKTASKHELRDKAKGRKPIERGQRKTPHQQVMSKLDRRNQARQLRLSKQKSRLQGTSIFAGKNGAPRIVAVVPLCADGNAEDAVRQLNQSLDIESELKDNCCLTSVDRFKQKLQYVPVSRDINGCVDAAKIADFVIVILSATEEVDALGELILRAMESQGMSTLFTVVQGLDKVEPAKQRAMVLGSLKSFIAHFHPDQEKLYSLDNRFKCTNLMRSLCSTTPKGIHWRDERSWMLVEQVQQASDDGGFTIVTGTVRGRPLQADRLVYLGQHGPYQIQKIVNAALPKDGKELEIKGQEEEILGKPSEYQDDLATLAPDMELPDAAKDVDDMHSTQISQKKGVLLDDHHYFTDEEEEFTKITKRVPKGTSQYQAAWYLDDASDSASDMEDVEFENGRSDEEDSENDLDGSSLSESENGGPSNYPQSEVLMQEPDEAGDAAQPASFRAWKRDEVAEEKEFPDEIELHPTVIARERLARYRGLKSLRTSAWQEDEDRAFEPEDWRRLLQISNYQASRSRCTREALVGGIKPGKRVHVYLSSGSAGTWSSSESNSVLTLFSLLRHENKKTVVNYLINLNKDYDHSLKAKEELIVQCGSRRMVVKPIFSQSGATSNDVHKYCRYLHPGQSAIASFIGPLTWGSVPVLFFKRSDTGTGVEGGNESDIGLTLVGTGTTLPPSTSRVVAKRVILTGHPYHIHKIVTIRYMFFNREDVEWFKALPLWTKRGRSGYIKEPLGTHGYFKATFDGRINPQDAVGVSLYKRTWPRESQPFTGHLLEATNGARQCPQEDVAMS